MNEYLVYKFLAIAVGMSILIWKKMKNKNESKKADYTEPCELEDGKFAIPKPSDEIMENVEFDEIKTDPKFKNDKVSNKRIPDPKGTPTTRP